MDGLRESQAPEVKAAAKNIPAGQRYARPTMLAARLSEERQNSHKHHLNFFDSVIRGLREVRAMYDAQRAKPL